MGKREMTLPTTFDEGSEAQQNGISPEVEVQEWVEVM
jgi:hypothetical protein